MYAAAWGSTQKTLPNTVFNFVNPIPSNREKFIQAAIQEVDQGTISVWLLEAFPSALPCVRGGSQSTARAPCSHHEHIQPAPLLPCPPGLRAAFGGERWQSPGERQERHRGRLCRAPSTGTASQEPQTLTFLWSRRQEECYSNPSVRAQTRNQYLPCSSTKWAPVELPVHICQETFLENGERRVGTVAHLLWMLNGKHVPSNWDREKYCCVHFCNPKSWELRQGSKCTSHWYGQPDPPREQICGITCTLKNSN